MSRGTLVALGIAIGTMFGVGLGIGVVVGAQWNRMIDSLRRRGVLPKRKHVRYGALQQ